VTATLRQGIRLCACPMRRLVTATLLLLLVLLPAARALAGDNASDLLIDACRDEHVDGTYSQRTFKRALDELPADSDQYTACRDVIERARIAALQKPSTGASRDSGRASTAPAPSTGSGSDGSGGGSATPAPSTPPAPSATPRHSSAGKQKRTSRASEAPATTATTTAPAAAPPVLPVGPVGDVTAPATRLPTVIVVLLAALALAALLAASTLAWNRVVVRRR
jgi:hypothetical protein